MSRELLRFAAQSIGQSGNCSLQLQTTPECNYFVCVNLVWERPQPAFARVDYS